MSKIAEINWLKLWQFFFPTEQPLFSIGMWVWHCVHFFVSLSLSLFLSLPISAVAWPTHNITINSDCECLQILGSAPFNPPSINVILNQIGDCFRVLFHSNLIAKRLNLDKGNRSGQIYGNYWCCNCIGLNGKNIWLFNNKSSAPLISANVNSLPAKQNQELSQTLHWSLI